MTNSKHFTAIIITAPNPVNGNTAFKYRKIKNDPHSLASFIQFAKGFPGALHINFYDRQTKKFSHQLKIKGTL